MKKITLFIFLLTASFGFAQNVVTISDADITNAYVNAFNTSDDSFAFGFGYTVADMKTTFPTSSSVVLAPNFAIWDENDDTPTDGGPMWDPDWFSAPNTPNKKIEGISYAENSSLAGTALTFIGTVDAATIATGYTVVAFIKILDSGYGTIQLKTADVTATGDFTVSATAAETGAGAIIQYGFTVTGLIADPTTEASLGTVNISARALSTNDFEIAGLSVYPNPAQDAWNIKTKNINMSSIEVFDILGKNIMSLKPEATEATINASQLKSGLYFAKISTANGSSSLKLVKQ